MQEVYRIDTIPAFKPWRGHCTYYITDKEIFDHLEAGANDSYNITWPDWMQKEEEEWDESFFEYLHSINVEVKHPYVTLDEVVLFVE